MGMCVKWYYQTYVEYLYENYFNKVVNQSNKQLTEVIEKVEIKYPQFQSWSRKFLSTFSTLIIMALLGKKPPKVMLWTLSPQIVVL